MYKIVVRTLITVSLRQRLGRRRVLMRWRRSYLAKLNPRLATSAGYVEPARSVEIAWALENSCSAMANVANAFADHACMA